MVSTHVGKRMKTSWSDANQTTNGWKPTRKTADPYMVALTCQSQAIQKTNSMDSLISFHDLLQESSSS